jgi:hypothetical protein
MPQGPSSPTPEPPVALARGWRHPSGLQDKISFDSNDADSGALGTGGRGDAMIAWEFGSRIYASERRGRVWRHPILGVSQPFNPAGGSMYDIAIDLDARGDTVMVWVQKDNGLDRIYMSEHHAGVWTNPRTHADHISPAGGPATRSQVVMEDNGDALVVWEQGNGPTGNGRIYKSELRAGTWTHPSNGDDRLSPDHTNAQDVHLAVARNGYAVVVWAQGNGPHYRIYKSERRNGIWAHPALADAISPAGSSAFAPAVACDGAGNAVIAWLQSDGSTPQVFVAEYRGGAWRAPASLTDNISPDGMPARRVQVALASNGDGVIVWRQDVSATATRLFKSEYRGGAWTHPTSLGAHFGVGPRVEEFAVAIDGAGNTVVAYTAADAVQPPAVYLSEYRRARWTHATSLAQHISPLGPATSLPRVSIDGDGDVVVLWRQSNGMHEHAFCSEYRVM